MMSVKVVVNYCGELREGKADSVKKTVADALGICCEDVVVLPNMFLTVLEVPDALTKAREKADKAAEKAAEEAKAAQEKAEAEAAKAAESQQEGEGKGGRKSHAKG